jgi:hypothetical protein
MALFFRNSFIFLLPLSILFLPPAFVLWEAGEFMSPQAIGTLARSGDPILVGQAYSNIRQRYQLQETRIRKPEVIALGTSRVGVFRDEFFTKDTLFYNDTGIADGLSLNRYFIEALGNDSPKVIIVGMDQFFFKPDNAKNNIVNRPNSLLTLHHWYSPFFEVFFLQGGWWKMYYDYFQGKFTLTQVFSSPNDTVHRIGLRALINNDGFLADGSNYFGGVIQHSSDSHIQEGIATLAESITDTYGDEYGEEISSEALREVQAFLAAAHERDITVIGFIPPLAPSTYTALKNHPEASYATSFNTLGPILSDLYKEYGYDFYDFTNIASIGGTDAEMVESKHGSEKMYLRMFITMGERSSALRPYIDMPFLRRTLSHATSSYSVFPLTAPLESQLSR